MPLLPQELRRAQERTRAHLPAHYVAPLVAQDGEIPPGCDPVLVNAPYDGLGGWPHDELFFQFCLGVHYHALSVRVVHQAVMGNHRALLCEACHVLGFLAEERFGDEQREISVLDAGLLEHAVQNGLHLFPDGISVWFYDHTSSDRGLFRKVCLHH